MLVFLDLSARTPRLTGGQGLSGEPDRERCNVGVTHNKGSNLMTSGGYVLLDLAWLLPIARAQTDSGWEKQMAQGWEEAVCWQVRMDKN